MSKHRWSVVSLLTVTLLALGLGACSSTSKGTATASAGPDQEVLIGDTVSLDGSGSVVVGNVKWTILTKPDGSSAALTDDTGLTPSFTADTAGNYTVELSIDDGASKDTLTVAAKVVLAVITNGDGSTIVTRTRFGNDELAVDLNEAGAILSGATSRGNVVNYSWSQVSGPFSTVSGSATGETVTFTAPSLKEFLTAGVVAAAENLAERGGQSDEFKWQPLPVSIEDTKLYFRLTVDDGAGNSDSTTMVVYVQDAGTEIKTSSGLLNVALGVPVYLQGPSKQILTEYTSTSTACNGSSPSTSTPGTANVKAVNDDWAWTLTAPDGSAAVFEDSGTTTTSAIEFPKFTPDVEGYYTVAYTATVSETVTGGGTFGCGRVAPNCKYTADGGVDRCTITGKFRMYAGTFVGVGGIGGVAAARPQCAACHNGTAEPDLTGSWLGTKHAMFYENSYNAFASLSPEPYLWEFGTVGYNTSGTNGGFDDAVAADSFSVAAQPATYAEFTTSHPDVAKLSSIQCENCHGPGSGHNGDATKIGMAAAQFGVCGQCHEEEAQWINSFHNSTGVSHGSGRYQTSWTTTAACTRCHTARGFINYLEEGEEGLAPLTEAQTFVGVTCAGCHNPHDATNAVQLRKVGEVEMLIDESTVETGRAAVCYTCHDGLYSEGEFSCDTNRDGVIDGSDDSGEVVNGQCIGAEATADFYQRGQHYGPQGPMLEGKGAMTDLNKDGIEDLFLNSNSFHTEEGFILSAVSGDPTLRNENDKCVTCHMSTPPDSTEDGFRHLGGHSFKVREGHGIGHLAGLSEEDETATGVAGEMEHISACTPCHTDLTTFNREARADYDGDGTIEGIQDEVKGLALLLSNAIKALDDVSLGTCSDTNLDAGSCVSKKCTLAPYISCTADPDCDTVDTCTSDATVAGQFCKTNADCTLRKITATSGTVNYGPCITATGLCTSKLGGTTDIECTDDNACIVTDALSFIGSATGFNQAGTDARPCLTSGSNANKCSEDTTISCSGGDNEKCFSGCGNYTAGKCDKDLTTSCTLPIDCNAGYKTARADRIRRARWNHDLVVRDASLGVHNAGYAVQVLQQTYKVLTGVAVPNAVLR